MNKWIKRHIFLFLLLSSTHIKTETTEHFFTSAKIIAFKECVHNLYIIAAHYPKLSLVFTTIMCLLGYPKLYRFFKKKAPPSQLSSKINVTVTLQKETGNATAIFQNEKQKNTYPAINSYEMSKQCRYCIAEKMIDESALTIMIDGLIIEGASLSDVMNRGITWFPAYEIIDLQSHEIKSPVSHAQQYSFSPNEEYLLVRFIQKEGRISRFLQRFNKTRPLLPEKDCSKICYQIIHLPTNTHCTISNALYVDFMDNTSIRVRKQEEEEKYYTLTLNSNLTSYQLVLKEIDDSIKNTDQTNNPIISENHETPRPGIEFYFNHIVNAYALKIDETEISYAIRYFTHKEFVCISIQHEKCNALDSIAKTTGIQAMTGAVGDKIKQKPTYDLVCFNRVGQKFIIPPDKPILNPVMWRFTNNNTLIYGQRDEKKNSIKYYEVNLQTGTTDKYKKGCSVQFNADQTIAINNKENKECIKKEYNPIDFADTAQKIKDGAKEGVVDFVGGLTNLLSQTNNNKKEKKEKKNGKNKKKEKIETNVEYTNYTFKKQKLSTELSKQTDYMQCIENGIHGLVLNLHIFKRDKFSSLVGDVNCLNGYAKDHFNKDQNAESICISHDIPKKMKYFSYQSFKYELSRMIDYVKTKPVLISLFLQTNDCTVDKIYEEVNAATAEQKYNPLFCVDNIDTTVNPLATMKAQDLIDQNKRVLLFSDKIGTPTKPFESIKGQILLPLEWASTQSKESKKACFVETIEHQV